MAYYGVRIGGYHSMDDWGCIMETKEIGYPELRTIKVEVPGKDGYLDLSDALRGRPMYDNRPIKIVLAYKGELSQFGQKVTEIAELIHGKVRSIVFDDEEAYTYSGRCSVNYEVVGLNVCRITIDVDGKPFKRTKTAVRETTNTLGGTHSSGGTIVGVGVSHSGDVSDKYSVLVKLPSALEGTQKAYIQVNVFGRRTYTYKCKLTSSVTEFDCDGDSFSPDENGEINASVSLYKKGGSVPSGYLTSVRLTVSLYKAVV